MDSTLLWTLRFGLWEQNRSDVEQEMFRLGAQLRERLSATLTTSQLTRFKAEQEHALHDRRAANAH